ncbi:MAG TPA: hypothetical protein ENJ19_07365, partial [Gammaproteobacteria bacterium]|nr:hypothetical protein [Gammaproteobacteria bacterium]
MLSHVALDLIDRPHLPERHQPDLALYKEWYHFNVVDETQGVDLIVNLSLDGDIYRPGHGEAKLIVLTCLHDDDWRGGVDVFDAAALNIRPNTVDITLGEQCVRFNDGR